MNKGDIYLISLDPTLGHEQQGKRPVLVIFPWTIQPYNQNADRITDYIRWAFLHVTLVLL